MKKLLSIKYSAGAFNFAMFLLRLIFGLLIILKHGYVKLMNFPKLSTDFYSFMHIGPKASLILAIFAEVFCGLFIVLGLFTRFAAIPLIITMLVAIFGADKGQPLIESELALVYLGAYVTLLLCGPGRISVDGLINK